MSSQTFTYRSIYRDEFLVISSTFDNTQIVLLNLVPLRRS